MYFCLSNQMCDLVAKNGGYLVAYIMKEVTLFPYDV